MTGERGISTVADVSLALLLVVAAVGVLVVGEGDEPEHEPVDAEYTTHAIAGSTTNVSYTVSEAIEAYFEDRRGDNPYERDELRRVSHGPIATQVADAAVANLTVDGQRVSRETADYERALDEQLQTRLLGSRFDTSISADWTPIEGVDLRGTGQLGERPPPEADVSTTTITVASGVPDGRERAIEAVDGPAEYGAVAQAVANATVAGLFPELESERALERGGIDSRITRYRYERLATVLDGDRSALDQDWLAPERADAGAANEYLADRLAATIEPQLEAHHGERYESAADAARAVSTDTVTITVRTWTDE